MNCQPGKLRAIVAVVAAVVGWWCRLLLFEIMALLPKGVRKG
jgi:hypothetical protein